MIMACQNNVCFFKIDMNQSSKMCYKVIYLNGVNVSSFKNSFSLDVCTSICTKTTPYIFKSFNK